MTPNEFIAKWHASELKERSAAQEHFIDLCRLLGEPTPADADPKGDRYCFERGALKDSGGEGWADVWKRHCFAWEYKGKHANLDAAFDQLRQYALALENPPLLIVSDMRRFRIRTTTFETFPFPEGLSPDIPPSDYRSDPRAESIASAARRLVELRNRWLNPPEWVEWIGEPAGYPPRPVPRDKKAAAALKKRTLTNLYNARPQWLVDAHAQLDAAVAAAYGWPGDITHAAALSELIARNRAKAGANDGGCAPWLCGGDGGNRRRGPRSKIPWVV